MTNHEIDQEIKRLQKLKTFEQKTADKQDFIIGETYYYCGTVNNVKEIVLTDKFNFEENRLVDLVEQDSFYFDSIFASKAKCLEENLRFKTFEVQKAEESLAKRKESLARAQFLLEEHLSKL